MVEYSMHKYSETENKKEKQRKYWALHVINANNIWVGLKDKQVLTNA